MKPLEARRGSRLDIIIASKNRFEEIARCLASIEAQVTRPDRIIVVDQSKTPYALASTPNLVHIYEPGLNGLPAARNRAIKEVRAELVLFLDDDVELIDDVIPSLVQTFDHHPDAVGAQCPFRQPPAVNLAMAADESRFKRVFSHGFFEEQPIRRADGCQLRTLHGCAMAFRTSLFQREFFDESLVGYAIGEDWDFAKRAQGHGTLWVADNAVLHHRAVTNRQSLERVLEQRLTNFLYFFRKMKAGRRPSEWLWLAWWLIGECYNAARHGINLLHFIRLLRS